MPIPADWIDAIRSWALGKEKIHELHLFGSRARDENLVDSDLDLAIVLLADTQGEADAYWAFECGEWRAELSGLVPVAVDLQQADPEGDAIVWPAVQADGVLIYRKPGYLSVAP